MKSKVPLDHQISKFFCSVESLVRVTFVSFWGDGQSDGHKDQHQQESFSLLLTLLSSAHTEGLKLDLK
jgi:hypothetical protein